MNPTNPINATNPTNPKRREHENRKIRRHQGLPYEMVRLFNLGNKRKIEEMNRMTEIAPRITMDEKIRFGKPVVKGTRVPLDLILGKLAGGMIMKEYKISKDDILAVLDYAAKVLGHEEIKVVG